MSYRRPFLKRVMTGVLAMSVLIPFVPAGFSSSSIAYGSPAEPSGAVMVEDFEHVNLADLTFDSARLYSGSMALETNPKYVRNGAKSLRIDYDFIGVTDNPSQVAVGPATQLLLTNRVPKKIGMWIYANNEGHGLTSKFYVQATGKSKTYEMRSEEVGIDWSGWKYVEAEIGDDLTLPGTLAFYFQMKERQMSKKNKGSIWIDDVRLIYDEPSGEDMDVPLLSPTSPTPDQTLNDPVSDLILSAEDVKSGIDPDSIRFTVDGQTVAPETYAYDLNHKTITYHPVAPLGGGYHQVLAEVKDLAGNPAAVTYAFNIKHGAMFTLEAPAEAISNEIYRLKLKAQDVGAAKGVHAKFKFDPETLLVSHIHARSDLTNVQTDIDNNGGYVEVSAEGLQGDNADALATIDFEVNRSAKMERGESYKLITMVGGGFGYAGGTSVNSFASPVHFTIGFPYTVTVKGSGLQTQNVITVKTHAGDPVEGAEIDFTDASGPQTYVTVTADTSSIYTSADRSSAELMTTEKNKSFFATTGSSAGFVKVYMPDGTKTGYIPSADVQQKGLTEGMGLTDSRGEIHTSLANLAIGTWKVQAVKDGGTSESFSMNVVSQFGGDDPTYVQTFVTEDMRTMMSVGWQTAPRINETYIQYVKDSDLDPHDLTHAAEKAKKQLAFTDVEVIHEVAGGPLGEIKFHQSLVTDLEPGTAYHYRVGYEGHWSTWYGYKTTEASPDRPVSFVFVTDSHTKGDNGLEIYQQLIGDALTHYPDTQFIMHGGDMVDDGANLNEWNQFWEASSIYAASIPSGYTMGNHDVKGEGKDIFAKGLNLPNNGPEFQKEYAYSFDSGEVHFIVLNSEADEVTMSKQAAWLREDIQNSDKKWKIVMFHKPAYHTEDGRGNVIEYTQTYFAPILEELKVDLVLEGHDHVYARTFPMNEGKPLLNGERGTVYLDGGASGWKFYDGTKYAYLDFMYDDDVPVYSAIQVSHDKITIQARTTESGELIDNYTIEKKDERTLASLSASPSQLTLNVGDKRQSVLTATYSDDSTADVTNQATWTSSDPSIAKVSSEGTLTGVAAGEGVTITASYGGKSIPIMVTVTAATSTTPTPTPPTTPKPTPTPSPTPSPDVTPNPSKPTEDKPVFNDKVNLDQVKAIVAKEHSAPAVQFSDVPVSLWSASLVGRAARMGIVTGYEDGSYHPDAKVTRAEFASMLVKAFGLTASGGTGFSDTQGHWASAAIAALQANGVITGYADGSFHPKQEITRAEIVAMLARLTNYVHSAATPFSDITTNWAAEQINAFAKAGIVSGKGEGIFKPNESASRAESVAMIIRLLDKLLT